jgi:hypothetical protein
MGVAIKKNLQETCRFHKRAQFVVVLRLRGINWQKLKPVK